MLLTSKPSAAPLFQGWCQGGSGTCRCRWVLLGCLPCVGGHLVSPWLTIELASVGQEVEAGVSSRLQLARKGACRFASRVLFRNGSGQAPPAAAVQSLGCAGHSHLLQKKIEA